MLQLKRRRGESIVVAGVVEVCVLAVEGGKVTLGVTFPPGITIDRKERWAEMEARRNKATDEAIRQRKLPVTTR